MLPNGTVAPSVEVLVLNKSGNSLKWRWSVPVACLLMTPASGERDRVMLAESLCGVRDKNHGLYTDSEQSDASIRFRH